MSDTAKMPPVHPGEVLLEEYLRRSASTPGHVVGQHRSRGAVLPCTRPVVACAPPGAVH